MIFCLVQHSRISFFDVSIVLPRTVQASSRADVDEAPYALGTDLLYVTALL